MKNITLIILTLVLLSLPISAKTYLAFFEVYNKDGTLMQLEENGRYAHVAISLGDKWLHSHPFRGVEIIDNLNEVGFERFEIVMLKNNHLNDKSTRYQHYIGKPYDYYFEWSDDLIYSSELVAKLLKLKPSKMEFTTPFWKRYPHLKGGVGLSPDDVYREARNKGFK